MLLFIRMVYQNSNVSIKLSKYNFILIFIQCNNLMHTECFLLIQHTMPKKIYKTVNWCTKLNSIIYIVNSWMLNFNSLPQFTNIYKCCLHCAFNPIYESLFYLSVTIHVQMPFRVIYTNLLCLSFMNEAQCLYLLILAWQQKTFLENKREKKSCFMW